MGGSGGGFGAGGFRLRACVTLGTGNFIGASFGGTRIGDFRGADVGGRTLRVGSFIGAY